MGTMTLGGIRTLFSHELSLSHPACIRPPDFLFLPHSLFMKSQTISNIGSGLCIAFHTIIVLLFIFSLRLILRVPLEGFRKTGWFLLALITFMLGLSTLALISTLMLNFAYPTSILATYQADYEYAYPTWGIPTRKLSQLYISVSIWAADWFMVSFYSKLCDVGKMLTAQGQLDLALHNSVSRSIKEMANSRLSSCFAMIMLSRGML